MKGFIKKLSSHALARDSAIVFAGSMVGNVGSYVYHLLMGRLLGPAGYGELSSLFSILYIFLTPLVVAQTVLVKFVSGFKAHGSTGQSKSLFVSVTKASVIICLLGLPVVLLISPQITSFLHLSSTTLFVMIYLLFVFSLLSIATASMLQGYQQFIWFSGFAAGAIILKVVLSVPLAHYGISGVLLAAIITSIVTYILYFLPLKFVIKAKSKPTNLTKRDTFKFAVPTLLTLLGITSLFSTDIILVRHFFGAKEAGVYAALAILGKVIYYASSAITLVTFPVLSEQTAKGNVSQKLIVSAVGGVALVSTAITALYFLFPNIIVRLLFGNAYVGAGALLGLFGIFIALFSVGNIISMISLAIGKTEIWVIPIVCAILQIVGIVLVHSSITTVIILNIGIAFILALGSLLYYVSTSHEKV